MSLFDEIVKTVDKSIEPGLESLTQTEISGISVNGDFDVDEDPMVEMAMEAMGKEVQYDADKDPEAAGFSDQDIEKLSKAGAEEEDEDDEYSEETIGELLDGYVEAVYGDPEDEDPTGELSEEDLDDIDDDFEDGMESVSGGDVFKRYYDTDNEEDLDPATEAINTKKDFKDAEKRLSTYEKELKDNKKNCDNLQAFINKNSKKAKKDAGIASTIASVSSQVIRLIERQDDLVEKIEKLRSEISDYKTAENLAKEEKKKAARLEKEAMKTVTSEVANVTTAVHEVVEDLNEFADNAIEDINEMKTEENAPIETLEKASKSIRDSIASVFAKRKKLTAGAASFCLGGSAEYIAEESVIHVLRGLGESADMSYDEEEPAEESSISIVNGMLEAFENYIGENVDELEYIYPLYAGLLDVQSALEAATNSDANEKVKKVERIKNEIEMFKKWIRIYGSQAVDKPSKWVESEIERLKNHIATLEASLDEDPVVSPA